MNPDFQCPHSLCPQLIEGACVTSGATDTDMVRQPLILPSGESFTCTEDSNFPALMKRFAKPEEIAAPIAFLLSDESAYVTKQEWYVDGGFYENSYVG